jgi:hypothetical protein
MLRNENMTLELTADQERSLARGEPIRLADPANGGDLILLRSQEYALIAEFLAEERAKAAIAELAMQDAAEWAAENPY